ncbi:hypothetical protein HNV12_04470 [Methanococcoides sp. SA1]|nr:hypothetical protein [Methanococcoides sp. SA1]
MDKNIVNWMLEGPNWLQYAVRLQLLNSKPDIGLALKDTTVTKIISRLKDEDFGIPAILLSSIAKMDHSIDLRLDQYIKAILASQRLDGDWHCAKRRTVGNKLQDTASCLMDNLNILALFGQYEKYRLYPRFNGAIALLLFYFCPKQSLLRLLLI